MAVEETNVTHSIMMDVSPLGVRLFKNVRGKFRTLDGLRVILAGLLVPGASDLIGIKSVIITPEMVGKRIGIFCAVVVKAGTGLRKEQGDFIKFVKDYGGLSGVDRSPEDARKILEIDC